MGEQREQSGSVLASSKHFFLPPTRVPVCLSDTNLLCYLHLFCKTSHVDFDHAIARETPVRSFHRNLSEGYRRSKTLSKRPYLIFTARR